LPNGTVRKGEYDGNQRKQWLEMQPEEIELEKKRLAAALKKAQEVEARKEKA